MELLKFTRQPAREQLSEPHCQQIPAPDLFAKRSQYARATSRPRRASVENTVTAIVKNYKIVVADDHAVVRRGLRALLDAQPGLEVCAEASSGPETLDCVRKFRPDLVVLDLTMPDMNGLDVTRNIRATSPSTAVLVLTMHFSEELAREVLRAGALAYVLKSDADTDLLAAVDHVRHNQPFFTGTLAASMAESFVRGADDAPAVAPSGPLPGFPLTNREVEIIQLLAEGKSNKQAAAELGVSNRTVESHRTHVMKKMNFRSFSDLVRFAVKNNLDRKSTRLNSSHMSISYAVFCLKKKKT